MDRERLLDDLKHDEGLSVEAYPDGDGYSIGYGHHSDDIQAGDTCTAAQANAWLESDVEIAIMDAQLLANECWDDLTDTRQNVLINMAYNLGRGRLSKFFRMWKAIRDGDYHGAGVEMLDSRWARQVGRRADRLAEEMNLGTFENAPW